MAGSKKGLISKEDVLNTQELSNLLVVCGSIRDKFIVYSFVFGGLRVGELSHLRRSWVNLQEKTITVPIRQFCGCRECSYINKKTGKSKQGIWKPKTKQGARTIRIHPYLFPVLKEFLATRDGIGLTRQRIWQRIKELAREAIILHNTYPHCLRATCATILAHDNISSPGLQHVLGWARLTSAESYVKSEEKRAIKEQDEIYNKYSSKT